MIKAKLFFPLVCLFLVESIVAQEYIFNISIGHASTSTYDLLLLQDEIISGSSLPLKKTDSFPDKPFLELGVNKLDSKGGLTGIYWNYHTTGGRVAVSDYSATVNSDQTLSNHELGLKVKVLIKQNSIVTPYFSMKAAAVFSQLELTDRISIPEGQSSSKSLIFLSQNAVLRPEIGLNLNTFKIPIIFNLSYLFQITQFPFYLKENRDAKLQISENNQIDPGLSGIRLGIGTEISF